METYIYLKNGDSISIEPEMIKEITASIEKGERYMTIINKTENTVTWVILNEISHIKSGV